MGIPEYGALDGLGLAALVRRGEVTPAELLEEAIARADRVNPHLNAVVGKLYDEARKAAAAPPRSPQATQAAFFGVPFLLKDLDAALAGAPMTSGSRYLAGYQPTLDSTLVGRYREAGLIVFGKTNTPELGLTPFTEPALSGPRATRGGSTPRREAPAAGRRWRSRPASYRWRTATTVVAPSGSRRRAAGCSG